MNAPRRIGPYEVVGELARGGQGVVYEAVNLEWNYRAAVKVLLDNDPVVVRRFQREADALARFAHPNLLKVKDLGEDGGAPYMALELIDGIDLSGLMKRQGPMPWERTVEVLATTARALHHCHEQGIVHRDVKPHNVLIEHEGHRPVLVDFGMVKKDPASWGKFSQASLTQLTEDGEILGTPAYMAPEQVDPKFGAVGPHTDVYALGATLYECLTGQPPYLAPTVLNVFLRIMEEPPPDPRDLNPSVPADLAALCQRAMSKSPDQRPADAAEFARLLEAADIAPPRSRRDLRWIWALAGVLLLAGATLFALSPTPLGIARRDAAGGAWASAREAGRSVAEDPAAPAAQQAEGALIAAEALLWSAGFERAAVRVQALREIDDALIVASRAGAATRSLQARAHGLRAYARLDAVEGFYRRVPRDLADALREDATRALELDPGEPRATFALNVADYGSDPAAGREAYARLLAGVSGLPRAEALACRAVSRAMLSGADQAGWERAGAELQEALELFPTAPEFDLDRAALLCDRGYFLRGRGLHAQAEACYEQALGYVPNYASALFEQGLAMLAEAGEAPERRAEAIERLRAALSGYRPWGDQFLAFLTIKLQRVLSPAEHEECLKLLEEAEGLFEAGRSLQGAAGYRVMRGRLLHRLGRLKEAKEAYEEGRRLAADEPYAGEGKKALKRANDALARLQGIANRTEIKGLLRAGEWAGARELSKLVRQRSSTDRSSAAVRERVKATLLGAEALLWSAGFKRHRVRASALKEASEAQWLAESIGDEALAARALGLQAYARLVAQEPFYRRRAHGERTRQDAEAALRLDPREGFALLSLAITGPKDEVIGEAARWEFSEAHFKLALETVRGRRRAEALACYGILAELQKEKGDAQLEEALEGFEGVAFDLDRAALWVTRGFCFRKRGDLERAEECYQEALEVVPNYACALFEQGNALLKRAEGSPKLRREALAKIRASVDGERAFAHYGLAWVEEIEKDGLTKAEAEEALQVLAEARKSFAEFRRWTNEPQLLSAEGRVLERLGRVKDARARYREAGEAYRTNGMLSKAAHLEAAVDRLRGDLRLARLAFAQGRWSLARTRALEVAKAGGEGEASARLLATEALLWGAGFNRASVRAQALSEIEGVLERSPDVAKAWGLRAYAYLDAGEPMYRFIREEALANAKRDVAQALKLNSQQPQALIVRAVLSRRRRSEEGIEGVERVVRALLPWVRGIRRAEVLACLGTLRLWNGLSGDDLRRAVDALPDSKGVALDRALLWCLVGYTERGAGRLDEAKACYQESLNAVRGYASALHELGMLILQRHGGMGATPPAKKWRALSHLKKAARGRRAMMAHVVEYAMQQLSDGVQAPPAALEACLALLSENREWLKGEGDQRGEGTLLHLRARTLRKLNRAQEARSAFERVLDLPEEPLGPSMSTWGVARWHLESMDQVKRRPR